MSHLLVWPNYTNTCSKKDLIQANQKAIDIAQYWQNLFNIHITTRDITRTNCDYNIIYINTCYYLYYCSHHNVILVFYYYLYLFSTQIYTNILNEKIVVSMLCEMEIIYN